MGYIYRSLSCPDATASYQALIQLTEQASNHNNQDLILLENLNLPDLKWVEGLGYQQRSIVSNPFVEYLDNNSLYQIINQPTWCKNNQAPSLLDLTITNNPGLLVNTKYIPPVGARDHVCISHDLLLS